MAELALGLDLSNPGRWSQVCLEQAHLVVVKDNVKIGLSEGSNLLQDVPCGIALVFTQAQVPPSLAPYPTRKRPLTRPMRMCRCSDLHVHRCTSAL